MAGAGIRHGTRNDQRIDSSLIALVKFREPYVLRRLATHARTGHNRGLLAKSWGKCDSRIFHGFTGCNDRKLRKWVKQARMVGFKVFAGVVAADLGAVLKP